MDRLHYFLILLFGVVSCTHGSGSVLEVSVRPGDSITLYCDCRLSTGVYIVWYRNCSHENQPALVLKLNRSGQLMFYNKNVDPETSIHFQFVRNFSSNSYDLLITNITESDEGLYYCGTTGRTVEDKVHITVRHLYTYGNITRIIISSRTDSDSAPVLVWMVMFAPAFTVLSSFISFILVYHFCQKAAQEHPDLQKKPGTTGETNWHQDEELCLTRVVFRVQDGQMHQ